MILTASLMILVTTELGKFKSSGLSAISCYSPVNEIMCLLVLMLHCKFRDHDRDSLELVDTIYIFMVTHVLCKPCTKYLDKTE